jgi:hypothetical protein
VLAVLTVIAVLAGASFLGGGIVLGRAMTVGIAESRSPEPADDPADDPPPEETEDPTPTPTPTEEPSPTPTEEPTEEEEPVERLTAEELVNELHRDFSIDARTDTTADVCTAEDQEDSPFQCTSAMDTDLVRVIAFESEGIAMFAAIALQGDEEGDAVDVQSACHFVLIWFDYNDVDQGERDDMTSSAEEIAGCL